MGNFRWSTFKNRSVILTIIIIVIIAILISGGSVYLWHKSFVKKMRLDALNDQQLLQQQIDSLQIQLSQITPYATKKSDFLKIYSYDAVADSDEISFSITISNKLSLLEKLKLLADTLSKSKFASHPINILRIEDRNDKRIAVVELKEPNSKNAFGWRGGFFQGSCGGYFTTITLAKTFLQEDYAGEWIDGAEFYYEGKPISDEWDHIQLSGTKYRKKRY